MFRTAIFRVSMQAAIKPQASLQLSPQFSLGARWNSSTTPPSNDTLSQEDAKKNATREWWKLQRDWDAREIDYAELYPKTLSPSPEAFLIDVREPDEVAQGMIPSAVNIPLTILPESLQLPPDAFKEKFGFSKPKPTQEVTFYCRSGKRSTSATDIAKRNGYQNVLNFRGSWLEWVEKNGAK